MIKQTEYKGTDNEALAAFYEGEYNNAIANGWEEHKAREYAKFMCEYYGHQFRKYE